MKLLSPVLSVFLIPLLVILPLQAQLPPPDPASALQVRLIENPTGADSAFSVEVSDTKGAPVADAAVAFRLPDNGATGTFVDGSHAAVVYTDAAGHARSPVLRWGDTPGSASLRITVAKGALHAGLLVEETVQPTKAVAAAPKKDAVAVSAASGKSSPAPGTLANAAPKLPLSAQSGASPAPLPPPAPEPTVSIVTVPGPPPHSSKKWLIIALVAAGAGVGAALALKGKGSAATTTAAVTPTIGTPSVSVGH